MEEKRLNIRDMTIGDLKELIKDIPDDTEIIISDEGRSGYVGEAYIEVNKWEHTDEIDVYICIEAESGYY